MVSDAIWCPLHNLKTVWNIIMILHSYVEWVMTMCHVREWQLSFLYFLSYLPLFVKGTMTSILNTVRNITMRLYSSVEEVVTMCLVYKMWRLLCSFPLPPPPPPPCKKKFFFFSWIWILPPPPPPPPPPPTHTHTHTHTHTNFFFPGFGFVVKIHLVES